MKEYDITTLDSLRTFAENIVEKNLVNSNLDQATLLTLSGDLGAGKTTFTQTLGAYLKIQDDINSPTYVIEQRYTIPDHPPYKELVHIDAYRLEQDDDPLKIGLDQTLQDPTKLVVLEWPEKIQEFLATYQKTEIVLSMYDEKRAATIKQKSDA